MAIANSNRPRRSTSRAPATLPATGQKKPPKKTKRPRAPGKSNSTVTRHSLGEVLDRFRAAQALGETIQLAFLQIEDNWDKAYPIAHTYQTFLKLFDHACSELDRAILDEANAAREREKK